MSYDKYHSKKQEEELRCEAEKEALEEENLDGADEIYTEPDRFSHTPSDEPQSIQSDEFSLDEEDFERTLI